MTGEKNNKSFRDLEIAFAGSGEPIRARLYGQGNNIVILSNTASNRQEDWGFLVEAIGGGDFSILIYSYPEGVESRAAVLDSVVEFLESEGRAKGEERIVLIGASAGGVASIQVAANRGDDNIVGIVAISSPLEHDGGRHYTDGDLRMITCPKLIICSEFDDIVEETRNIFAMLEDPRRYTLYPGDAHGADLLAEHGESLALQLEEFIVWAFNR